MPKGFLIDMEGVIYCGNDLIEGADIFIAELKLKNLDEWLEGIDSLQLKKTGNKAVEQF